MPKSDETWNEVGEGFSKLGSMFKLHYESQEADEGVEAVSEDEVKAAVRTLGESIKAAFSTIGDAVQDPEVQKEAKQTARSFLDALGASFSELGDEISKWRERGRTDKAPDPTEATPAESNEPLTDE